MAREEFQFCFPFRVRYAEVDQQQIVFNAHYLTYFDTAITEYFRDLPYDYMAQVAQLGEDFHTVRSLIDYHAPIRFDDDIEVHVRVSRLGRTSVTFALEIYRIAEDEPCASGQIVWVNTAQSTHRAAPLPSALVERVTAREGLAIIAS